MLNYSIISSSSSGNAVKYYNEILIDVGVNFTRLEKHLTSVKYIFLTHCHGDHFQLFTIKRIARERPDILWIVPEYLLHKLEDINLRQVLPVSAGRKYRFGDYKIEVVELYHDVPNVGYKMIGPDRRGLQDEYKIIHATDTGSIDHIEAKDFDLYAIEHNYDELDIFERILDKISNGLFSHERRAVDTHLSFQQAESFILSQRKESSEVIKLHVSSYYTKKESA